MADAQQAQREQRPDAEQSDSDDEQTSQSQPQQQQQQQKKQKKGKPAQNGRAEQQQASNADDDEGSDDDDNAEEDEDNEEEDDDEFSETQPEAPPAPVRQPSTRRRAPRRLPKAQPNGGTLERTPVETDAVRGVPAVGDDQLKPFREQPPSTELVPRHLLEQALEEGKRDRDILEKGRRPLDEVIKTSNVGQGSSDGGSLKIRLDLNLEVDVELKLAAKLKGDLTISLLN